MHVTMDSQVLFSFLIFALGGRRSYEAYNVDAKLTKYTKK